jgi:hypothetical protein
MLDVMTLPAIDAGPNDKPPTAAASKALEERKKKFKAKSAARGYLVERCKTTMTSSRASCILAANSEDALAKCTN